MKLHVQKTPNLVNAQVGKSDARVLPLHPQVAAFVVYEAVEEIFARHYPNNTSGYDDGYRGWHVNLDQNFHAIVWGCSKAEELASLGCYAQTNAFLGWALHCYWPYMRAPEDCRVNKLVEARIIRAAWCVKTWGGKSFFAYLSQGNPLFQVDVQNSFPALSPKEWDQAFRAYGSDLDPLAALYPGQCAKELSLTPAHRSSAKVQRKATQH